MKRLDLRQTSRNVSVAVASLLTVMLIVELLLRSTHLFGARISWAEPDPLLGWKFTPNRSYWVNEENDHPITGRINSYGWRDREWTLRKREGTLRVAVIGDSFVEAFQVEQDSTFLRITERALGGRAELMNFGRMGMTQTEELQVLERHVAPFAPDMVVLFFMPANDIADINPVTATNEIRPFYRLSETGKLELDRSFVERRTYRLKALINPLKQRSALVSLILEKYNKLRWIRRTRAISRPPEDGTGIAGFLSLCTAHPDRTFADNYELNKILIGRIATYCQERGIRFMLACTSTLFVCGEAAEYKRLDPSFDVNFFDNDLRALAADLSVDYLGLERPFAQSCAADGRTWYWKHWNYIGHRGVAAALVAALKPIL